MSFCNNLSIIPRQTNQGQTDERIVHSISFCPALNAGAGAAASPSEWTGQAFPNSIWIPLKANTNHTAVESSSKDKNKDIDQSTKLEDIWAEMKNCSFPFVGFSLMKTMTSSRGNYIVLVLQFCFSNYNKQIYYSIQCFIWQALSYDKIVEGPDAGMVWQQFCLIEA